MDQCREFVMIATLDEANISALCQRFGIIRQTNHLRLRRAKAGEAVKDRLRPPHSSPRRRPDDLWSVGVDLEFVIAG